MDVVKFIHKQFFISSFAKSHLKSQIKGANLAVIKQDDSESISDSSVSSFFKYEMPAHDQSTLEPALIKDTLLIDA